MECIVPVLRIKGLRARWSVPLSLGLMERGAVVRGASGLREDSPGAEPWAGGEGQPAPADQGGGWRKGCVEREV